MTKRTLWVGLLLLVSLSLAAQEKTLRLSDIPAKDLAGKEIKLTDWIKPGQPMILSFWATWCVPCVKELEAYTDLLPDWQKETGVKLVAVSIDNSRTTSRVKPFVVARGWEFPVLLDPNENLKRAMNVVNVPHTFLIDDHGKVVWQHTSYKEGDEQVLYSELKKLK